MPKLALALLLFALPVPAQETAPDPTLDAPTEVTPATGAQDSGPEDSGSEDSGPGSSDPEPSSDGARPADLAGPFDLSRVQELPFESPLEGAFSLRLWLADVGPGRLVELPGCLRLDLMPDRRLRLSADGPDGDRLYRWAPRPLDEQGRTWVGLTVDRERFGHITIVGAGAPVALVGLTPADAPVERLQVGGASGRLAAFEVHREPLSTESLLQLAEEPEPPAPPSTVVGGARGWGGVERTHLAVEDGALVWAPAQWRRDPVEPGPTARTAHPMAMFPDGRVVVFSGEVRDTHVHPMRTLADTWIYEPDGTAPGVGRWREVEGPAPRGRSHQGMAPLPWADAVLLIAGWDNGPTDGPPETLTDAWLFDAKGGRWAELFEPTRVPVPLSDAPICWVPSLDACVVFGTDRPYALDRGSNAWRPLPPYTRPEDGGPADWPGRSSGVAVDPEGGRVVLVGGVRWRGRDLSTRWMLDETRIWNAADGTLETLTAEPHPDARTRPVIGFDPALERVLLFGGSVDQSTRRDDFWTLDLDERRWRRHRQADCPGPRGGFMSPTFDEQRGELVMIHGRSGLGRFHQDVWRLRFDPEATARASVELALTPAADRTAQDAGAGTGRDARARAVEASAPREQSASPESSAPREESAPGEQTGDGSPAADAPVAESGPGPADADPTPVEAHGSQAGSSTPIVDPVALVELSGGLDASVRLVAERTERGVRVELEASGVDEDDPLRVHRIELVPAATLAADEGARTDPAGPGSERSGASASAATAPGRRVLVIRPR